MYKILFKYSILCIVFLFLIAGCRTTLPIDGISDSVSEENSIDKNAITEPLYAETIKGLSAAQQYTYLYLEEIEYPVLLVADKFYDDNGKKVTIICDVYYIADGTEKNIGTLMSQGTAYAIRYDDKFLYTVEDNKFCQYGLTDDEKAMVLVQNEAFEFKGASQNAELSLHEQYSAASAVDFSVFINGQKEISIEEAVEIARYEADKIYENLKVTFIDTGTCKSTNNEQNREGQKYKVLQWRN